MDETNVAHCVIRLVIPTGKAGFIIGKGGANVKQLSEETGARVKIFECPTGCDERVVGPVR
jgi:ribosomal protein S3